MYSKTEVQEKIRQAVRIVRETNPMAPSITNSVTINFVANAQLAVGGSAAMVYLPDEGEFVAQVGGATYINVGTLLPIYEETLPRTAKTLHTLGKTWVLDPVAIGIGEMRTKLLSCFREYKPSVIRGNASEIIALAGLWKLDGGTSDSAVRGVDSTDTVAAARQAAVALAKFTGGAVAVSGETDLITDGETVAYSHGGSKFMEMVTGSGCSLGGVTAVVKGLRLTTDFEYELQQANLNYRMAPELEEIFVMGGADYGYVSSSAVREIAELGGDVAQFVTPNVEAALRRRYPLKVDFRSQPNTLS